MNDPLFFQRSADMTLEAVIALTGAMMPKDLPPDTLFSGVAPLDRAGPTDLAFLDNPHYSPQLAITRAGAVFVAPKFVDRAPPGLVLLVTPEPYRCFARTMAAFYPESARPGSFFGGKGVSPGAVVHPDARLEPGVTVDPGAVIGPRVEIGSGSVIGANAVIGPGVRIGRDCSIGPNSTLQHCLIGNRIILHPGVHVGQDGFGFAMGAKGHLKVPQIGRVVIQDDVEIGAGTTVDRGTSRDTVIGEGTKIDNQVQIAHNVVIGRHCVLVAQVGVAGSSYLEDFVVMGGGAGSAGHLRIGTGAQIAGGSHVKDDVPPGARMAGTPARPIREFVKELAALKKLASRQSGKGE